MAKTVVTDYGTKDMDVLLHYYEIDQLSPDEQLKVLRRWRGDAYYEIQTWHAEHSLMSAMIEAIESADRSPDGEGQRR
jgi:hypothetical protein